MTWQAVLCQIYTERVIGCMRVVMWKRSDKGTLGMQQEPGPYRDIRLAEWYVACGATPARNMSRCRVSTRMPGMTIGLVCVRIPT